MRKQLANRGFKNVADKNEDFEELIVEDELGKDQTNLLAWLDSWFFCGV